MRFSTIAALVVCLASARQAAAQIPRDPLAGGPVNGPTETATDQAARELPKMHVTRQAEVEIPFSVRSGTTAETQPTAVRIFISWDQGKSWHYYDERRPQEGRFRFRPRQDGEFWFATQTIDRSGKPDNAQPRTPQLRLLIDTQRPQLVVRAQVDESGGVQLAWSASDPNLVPSSLKVEYQDAAGTGGPWEAVALSAATPASGSTQSNGQTTIRPAVSSRTINLRAEVSDGAGNVAYHSQRLSLVPPSHLAGGSTAGPVPDPPATPWPSNRSPQSAGESASRSDTPVDNERVTIPNVVHNPFVGKDRLASTSTSRRTTAEVLPLPSPATTDAQPPAHSPPIAPRDPAPPSTEYSGQNEPAPEVMPLPRPTESVEPPSGERPRLTNSRRFSLDYDVQSIGPEGLAAVELWGTTNRGQSWTKWGSDPDKASPFDVEVNHEATYGFRIVIVGNNGLATSTPQPGDAADIWVRIDLTTPKARLTGAAYGQGDAAGKLDIRWEAEDESLGARPITLSLSDRTDGPFTPIATGLTNSGQYYWEFDPRSPRQIYLRLEVSDEAGNVAIDQLTEPIKVEGLEPKAHIRGFAPGR